MFCNPCSEADPVSDTVKVDLSALAALNKENESSNGNLANSGHLEKEQKLATECRLEKERELLEAERCQAEEKRRLEEERRRAAAEEARAEKHRIQEEIRKAEESRLAEIKSELKRQQAEEARQQAAQQEAEEAAQREQEDRRRREEAERLKAEEESERLRVEQVAADQVKLEGFLKEHGYVAVNTRKKAMFSYSFPLHTAVTVGDATMIRILLAAGADAKLKNSSGKTAAQVAQKHPKNGSLNVLRQLGVDAP